ncbi:MAG TPA: hypothetical protein VGE44_02265 [Daejeonella sp.]|uniref:hypothetical protein n=1 Tax=Daejeonella sp. TaxID=2805397 RepID=UPI002EDB6BB6
MTYKIRNVQSAIKLYFIILLLPLIATGQSVSDTSYHFAIKRPMYQVGTGSAITFDESHNNPHTLKGAYYAFNKLLTGDGYVLKRTREQVTASILKNTNIYITVNAMADPSNWDLPTHSVFKDHEINEIYEWVKKGGSLFLITDHMPCPASVNKLAEKFGFNILNGFALRKGGAPEIFSRLGNNLHSNLITNTRGAVIDSIRIWGGTGFIVPKEASVISKLDENYTVYLPSKASEINYPSGAIPSVSGLGLVNGAFLKYGKGKVVVFGDSAPFTAQLQGIGSDKRGMNHVDASQNAQFLLNIIHWLDNKL